MIRILKEEFKNLPSWLKPYMNKGVTKALDRNGIDLYNSEYEDASDITPRDPRWKTGGILTVLLRDPIKPNRDPVLYMWGFNNPESDPLMSDGKFASKHGKSWIIDNAIKIGFIKKNSKPKKDRYQDPRYDMKGNYAGQTYQEPWISSSGEMIAPGKWLTRHGRDKSGYIIPDPAELVGQLYDFNLDNTAEVLDRYYNKIISMRDQLMNIDFRSLDERQKDYYDTALYTLRSVTSDFIYLERDIKRTLEDMDLDMYELSGRDTNSLFKRLISTHKISLDKNIKNLKKSINELK